MISDQHSADDDVVVMVGRANSKGTSHVQIPGQRLRGQREGGAYRGEQDA